MIEPSLALQTAVRQRLVTTPAVTAIIDKTNIRDGITQPSFFPSVIIGDGQTVTKGDGYRSVLNVTAFLDLHVWTREQGMVGAKTASAAIWAALREPLTVAGWLLTDGLHVTGTRYLRDPSHEHSHAVISLEAFMMRTI